MSLVSLVAGKLVMLATKMNSGFERTYRRGRSTMLCKVPLDEEDRMQYVVESLASMAFRIVGIIALIKGRLVCWGGSPLD